jgi:hypothetical protein
MFLLNRRIPNTGHNIGGYEDSLASFYLSIADVSKDRFCFRFIILEHYIQKAILPSMKWTRTVNGTHGVIRADIDFSSGQPKPTAVSAYQARTSDTLRQNYKHISCRLLIFLLIL